MLRSCFPGYSTHCRCFCSAQLEQRWASCSTCGVSARICVVTIIGTLCQVLALEVSCLHIFLESPNVWRWREVGKGRNRDEREFWPEPDGEASERQAREEAKSSSVDVSLPSSAHSLLLSCAHFFLPPPLFLISGIPSPASLL